MFCPNCGKDLPAGTKFCIGCGTKMPVITPVVPPITTPPATDITKTVPEQPPVKTKRHGKAILIAIISALVIVALTIGGVFVYKHLTRPFTKISSVLAEHDIDALRDIYDELTNDDEKKELIKETKKYAENLIETYESGDSDLSYNKICRILTTIQKYIIKKDSDFDELVEDFIEDNDDSKENSSQSSGNSESTNTSGDSVASTDSGSAESTDISTETGTSADSNTPDISVDPIHISVTRPSFNIYNPDSAQVKKVEDKINEYLDEREVNIEISLTDISTGEYTDRVSDLLARKEINLLWTASWESLIGTNDLISMNAVYDITNLLHGTTLYYSMDSSQWKASSYNHRNYFVPIYKDNVEGYDFMFRKDLVDKYGWDVTSVKTLADLEPLFADAQNEGLRYPFLTQSTPIFSKCYIDQFDFFTLDTRSDFIAINQGSNSVVNTILTPEYREFVTLMAKWSEAGYLSSDDLNRVTSDYALQTKDWAISWWTDIPLNEEASYRYYQDIVIVPATRHWANSYSNLGSCYCVTANSTEEEAQACIDFLGLLYTDNKLADLWTFGIEGEDFYYNTDGSVYQFSSKYSHSMWESTSVLAVSRTESSPENIGERYHQFNLSAQDSCAAGFRFDRSNVEAQYWNCRNVFDEYGYALEHGGVAVDEIDYWIAEYATALDNAGFQDILKEAQKQYNEWKR